MISYHQKSQKNLKKSKNLKSNCISPPSYRTIGAGASVDETLFGTTKPKKAQKDQVLIVGKDTVQIVRAAKQDAKVRLSLRGSEGAEIENSNVTWIKWNSEIKFKIDKI
jgi:hypothetical protein